MIGGIVTLIIAIVFLIFISSEFTQLDVLKNLEEPKLLLFVFTFIDMLLFALATLNLRELVFEIETKTDKDYILYNQLNEDVALSLKQGNEGLIICIYIEHELKYATCLSKKETRKIRDILTEILKPSVTLSAAGP